jgi:hypothetical protein
MSQKGNANKTQNLNDILNLRWCKAHLLEWVLNRNLLGRVNWTDLAQDMDKWWALVKAVTNLRVPINTVNFLTG